MLLFRREYHFITRGFLLQEIVRRVDPQRRTIGKFVEEEIATKLKIDIHIGLSKDKQKETKIADCTALAAEEVIDEMK